MLPMMCIHPPCRNIDVKMVRYESGEGACMRYAGVSAKSAKNACARSGVGSESSYQKTTALRTMSATVTKANVRAGLSSRSGIISPEELCQEKGAGGVRW